MKKYLLPFFCFVLLSIVSLHANGQIITTIAGNGTFSDGGDGGPATAAQLEYVWFVTTDTTGNVYITDNFDHRVRKVNTAGIMSTLAGSGAAGFGGDGGPAGGALFIGAAGIATDRMGNTCFSDINNRRIRKVNAAGIISTIAGDGIAGFSGDGGPATAALLNAPYGVATDYYGNIFFADELNNRIRKINAATGIITTIAGNGTGGYSGDGGPATAAELTPLGVAVDVYGNIFFATADSRVRKVNTATGIITTVAGNGLAGYSGDGGPAATAKLNQPVGVAVDGLDNVFISDQYNYRIRKVNASGIISTIAGDGTAGFAGDGGPAATAEVRQPLGISTDPYGDIYFCDWGNYRVREIISGNHIPSFINRPVDSIAVCENSTSDSLNALLGITDIDAGQAETWSLFSPAQHGTAMVAYTAVSTGGALTPFGITYTPLTGYSGYDTFKVRIGDGYSLDTITIYVRVKPLPDTGLITGSTTVCVGRPDTLADTAIGGVWSVTNANASISSTGVITGLVQGTDTVLNSFALEGCFSRTSTVVTIYPVTDTIYGYPAVCTGESILLTGGPAGGFWSVTNTFASMSGGTLTGDSAGVDTVIYTISNVCGVFSTIAAETVIGFTIPGVTISASPPTIIAGENDTLVVHMSNTGGITYGYQWEVNGTTIPGATDSIYISNAFSNDDSVTCFVSNGPCFFSTFSWIYITYHNDGVQGITSGTSPALFPNPNTGSFTVYGTVSSDTKEATLEITDITGRELEREVVPISNGIIKQRITPAANMPAGVYLLHVITGDGSSVIKFVVAAP